jgi:type IV pilus assembly protein PilP
MTVPMNKMKKIVLTAIVSVAMVVVTSCKEKAPPAPKSQVVKQKIATQHTQPPKLPATADQKHVAAAQPHQPAPQTAAATAPKPVPAAALPDSTLTKTPASSVPAPEANPKPTTPNSPKPAAQANPSPTVPAKAGSGGDQAVSDLVKESMAITKGYDPQGRIDPFEPLFREESNAAAAPVAKGKHKRRKPQTPLERVALSQLKLSAIMRTPQGNYAIVEDATGKGYVIKKGTYIGLNSGQVTDIGKDGVSIEEEVENAMGDFVIQNTELKLQKPAGEL